MTDRTSEHGIRMQTNAMIPISCSFDTDYNTDHVMTIQEGATVSDSVTDTTTDAQFEFDIVMRADANLIQEFSGDRVIGDMHYFTVRLSFEIRLFNSYFRLFHENFPQTCNTKSPDVRFLITTVDHTLSSKIVAPTLLSLVIFSVISSPAHLLLKTTKTLE